MADDNHCDFDEYDRLHKRLKKRYVNGACLNGRCASFYEEHTCSYRYQGIKKGRENKQYYKIDTGDKAKNKLFEFGQEKTISVIFQAYKEIKAKPGQMDWCDVSINGKISAIGSDVTENTAKSGRHKNKQVRRKDYTFLNFTTGSVPYSNQVHHIIPCEVLNDNIMQYENIFDVISKGLLEEKYNINFKDNMIILPADERFSKLTGLPQHLGSHPTYSGKVSVDVDNALKGYESIDSQYDSTQHDKPDPIAVKEQLESKSETWYQKIVDYIPVNKAAANGQLVKINGVGTVSVSSAN